MYLSVVYCILVWQAGTNKPCSKEEDDEDDAYNGEDNILVYFNVS